MLADPSSTRPVIEGYGKCRELTPNDRFSHSGGQHYPCRFPKEMTFPYFTELKPVLPLNLVAETLPEDDTLGKQIEADKPIQVFDGHLAFAALRGIHCFLPMARFRDEHKSLSRKTRTGQPGFKSNILLSSTFLRWRALSLTKRLSGIGTELRIASQ